MLNAYLTPTRPPHEIRRSHCLDDVILLSPVSSKNVTVGSPMIACNQFLKATTTP